jgi:hypothetical protein
LIPEYSDSNKDGKKEARFINLSGLARNLAGQSHTLNIFLLSTLRVDFDDIEIKKLYAFLS